MVLPGESRAPDQTSAAPGDRGKYRFGAGQRKLPRPIVFWSDNERDAFRRNKILQTHCYIRLDDIETQRQASKRAIKFEAYKIRERSARLYSKLATKMSTNKPCERPRSSMTSSGKDQNQGGSVSADCGPNRKSTVRFSVYKEFIPPDGGSDSDTVQTESIDNSTWICQKVRSLSASGKRLDVSGSSVLSLMRSKSTPPSADLRRVSVASSVPSSVGSRSNSEMSRSVSGKTSRPDSAKSQEKSLSPNKMFFDRSQSAYELRRELKRLAKTRRQRMDPAFVSVETALRDQKQHYVESRAKVADYLERLKQEEWYKPDRRAYVMEEL